MGEYVKKKKDMIFQSGESLQQVVNVVNEAAVALNDKKRTIRESSIPEVLAGALGAGIGGSALLLRCTVSEPSVCLPQGSPLRSQPQGVSLVAAWSQGFSFSLLRLPP